jgi:hypothetical protein
MTFLIDQSEYLRQQSLEFPPSPLSNVERQVMRNGIRFFTSHVFAIPYPVAVANFSYYKLLYWSGHHTLESIEAGIIVRDDIAFIVRYHRDLTRGKILANPDAQYAISFRAPRKDWNIDPIVLISEATK